MKQSTIDSVIDTFDESYNKNKDDLYLKYHSVDKFVELSQDYVSGLNVDIFENRIFHSYFNSHVKSMYRRDFEKLLIESEKNDNIPLKKHASLIRFSWGAIFGATGWILGYAATQSVASATACSMIGIGAGLYLANKGIRHGNLTEKIVGTPEYNNKLRDELYSALKQ